MEIGTCPRCARPYTVSDVVGFGILRPRLAKDGGPRVEYACPDCGRRIDLIPYGEGRFALPGEPPPPAAPPEERRPPWVRTGERPGRRRAAVSQAPPHPQHPEEPGPPPPEPPPPVVVPPAPAAEEEVPLDWEGALALLGCGPTDGRREIERAFRERSRTCHPDKVAHLDPEFQALAERKFKRLREAYDLLLG